MGILWLRLAASLVVAGATGPIATQRNAASGEAQTQSTTETATKTIAQATNQSMGVQYLPDIAWCGGHHSKDGTCAGCPEGNGAAWCNGDCEWKNNMCRKATSWCGGHWSKDGTCPGCPEGHGAYWCNGDCAWKNNNCRSKNECPEEIKVSGTNYNHAWTGIFQQTHHRQGSRPVYRSRYGGKFLYYWVARDWAAWRVGDDYMSSSSYISSSETAALCPHSAAGVWWEWWESRWQNTGITVTTWAHDVQTDNEKNTIAALSNGNEAEESDTPPPKQAQNKSMAQMLSTTETLTKSMAQAANQTVGMQGTFVQGAAPMPTASQMSVVPQVRNDDTGRNDETSREQAHNKSIALMLSTTETATKTMAQATNQSMGVQYLPDTAWCGGHHSKDGTCAGCPEGNGAAWCNGDCEWKNNMCRKATSWCGGHWSKDGTCPGCPEGHGAYWCNGDCAWKNNNCRSKNECPEEILVSGTNYNHAWTGIFQQTHHRQGSRPVYRSRYGGKFLYYWVARDWAAWRVGDDYMSSSSYISSSETSALCPHSAAGVWWEWWESRWQNTGTTVTTWAHDVQTDNEKNTIAALSNGNEAEESDTPPPKQAQNKSMAQMLSTTETLTKSMAQAANQTTGMQSTGVQGAVPVPTAPRASALRGSALPRVSDFREKR